MRMQRTKILVIARCGERERKLSSVSIVFDLNLPAETTVCGMSSRFFQVTVVPTFTVSCAGSKVKLSIITFGPRRERGRRTLQEYCRGNGQPNAKAEYRGCGE
jgi:hypothetical protein